MTLDNASHELVSLEHGPTEAPEAHTTKKGLLREALNELTLRGFLAFLRETLAPDILQRRKPLTRRLGTTSWLDGLRGLAALCVCFSHLAVYTHAGLELCYGAPLPSGQNRYNDSVAALPIVRLLFVGGHFSVMLFYLISGYVVPRRLLKLIHDGRPEAFAEAVQSALIRRPVRLYLPVIFSTFFFFSTWHIFGIQTPWPAHQSNIITEAWHWVHEMLLFSYFFRIGWLFTTYNVHTWTIPVELRGSLLLIIWLFALHTLKIKTRLLLTMGLIVYFLFGVPGAWYAGFLFGMYISELDLLAVEANPEGVEFPWDRFMKWFKSQKVVKAIVLHTMLVAGLYLSGQPSNDFSTRAKTIGNCHGWKTLSWLIPTAYHDDDTSQYRWFWLFWAACFVLYAAKEIDWLRWTLETPPVQYLGKHSFALYLIHGPMIGILSERLFYMTGLKHPNTEDEKAMFGPYHNKWHDASWWFLPDGGPFGLEPSFLFCVAISVPCFLYVAEVGTRLFDVPSVKVSRWISQEIKRPS